LSYKRDFNAATAFSRAGQAHAFVPCTALTQPDSITTNKRAYSGAKNIWEDMMTATNRLLRFLALPICLAATLSIGSAAEPALNPAALVYKMPDQIPWGPVNAAGAQSAVVVGDPSKPGFYMVYNKWTKGNHFSHPHFHPNDRYIVVLQGTWWVGTGPKWDPEHSSVPMPPGSFVTHFGKQVHWDGAKDEDAVLLIMGEGPATSTPVPEEK
jgi:hypothetical protein